MFKCTQTDGSLDIRINRGLKECKNNLSQFYGKNFNNIIIDGGVTDQHKHIKQSEFLLRSYNSIIDKMEMKNCSINLDQAVGFFQQITFTNCTFVGTLTDQFHAISLDIQCGVQLSSFAAGDIEQINLIVKKQPMFLKQLQYNFSNTNLMKNLNNLTFQNTIVDLSEVNGTWKQVQFLNCQLKNNICQTFKAFHMFIESGDQNILLLFKNYRFDHIQFKFKNIPFQFDIQLFNSVLLQSFKWTNAELYLEYCIVDLQQLCGNFSTFQAVECLFKNSLSQQFSCNKIVFLDCSMYQESNFNSNILKDIQCDSIQIKNNAIIQYLPNIKELILQNCKIRLKNQLPTLEKLTLNYCDLQNLGPSQVPMLKELVIPRHFKTQHIQPLQEAVQVHLRTQKQKDNQPRLIEAKKRKQLTLKQRIKEEQEELQYCVWIITYNFKTGHE
ncbi:Leucine-rich_repeat domain superfamily [Hexamita inflata]|uniref:Leucine-rich repeat domain superfamily n=1 Tax=Hexamita inflata TaxID=28002 RepID=A0AA86RA05_9EUKA|nr:Leucine-rich repeat domain superfamily [Hexamita inflata]